MGHVYQLPILELRSKYNLELAIETGTQHGEGALELLKHFHWVYTIEINPKLWSNAYILLQEYAGARCLLGSSPYVLDLLLSNPDRPNNILFWLDAHFPDDKYVPGAYGTIPLESELEVIRKHREKLWKEGKAKDVIIIDDARIWKLDRYAMGNWEHCLNDIDFLEEFYLTHDLELHLEETGFFYLLPKL